MTNIFKGPTKNSLIGLITGPESVKFDILNEKQKINKLYDQIYKLYNIKLINVIICSWLKEGCFAGTMKPGPVFYKYSHQLSQSDNNLYFASSDTSDKFYGYMEGAIRSSVRVFDELTKNL